jgi:hypothetical protein
MWSKYEKEICLKELHMMEDDCLSLITRRKKAQQIFINVTENKMDVNDRMRDYIRKTLNTIDREIKNAQKFIDDMRSIKDCIINDEYEDDPSDKLKLARNKLEQALERCDKEIEIEYNHIIDDYLAEGL